ncbi:putative C6 transcription factor [Aspergillus lucknowensis]|uniref:Zn(2)-C6 fungal-type domain-containing protein n=1 Tax=Aspergillus lucknowensis TaxID=176173 RepID=A0ABR4LGK8_9EURO
MDNESPDSDAKETIVRRACDQCRQRKIRCDKRSPCSNCRTSKIICSSTGAGQKPREPRKRVLISNEYEKKIDHIDERLGGIEQILRELKAGMGSNTGSQMCPHATPVSRHMSPSVHDDSTNPRDPMDQQESKNGFEGSSLMATQSAYASNFLETAVSRFSSLQMPVSKVNAALSTLKQLVNMQDGQASSTRDLRSSKNKTLSGCDLREMSMPPLNVVLPLLRNAKENYGTALQSYCPFVPFDRLAEKCREVYFATEDYSDATFIVANGGLYQIFAAASFMTPDRALREEYQKYVDMCKDNLEKTLANLHLLMPATPESIEALTMGASHAIEISKPSFALTLTSTASRLCQALDYHRMSSLEGVDRKEKGQRVALFWSIYCMDRALSLRLGRAPTIPEYDIDLPPNFGEFEIGEPWKTAFTLWIELARIQGLVYEKLYCPAALRQDEKFRVAEARKLASEMLDGVMNPFKGIYPLLERLTPIESLYIRCDEVCRFSVLTLIYRAIPPQPGTAGTFIDECIEAARGALQSHKSCMLLLKEATEASKLSYLHWSILYSPFVPFVVLFCHIIEVSSWVDLDRLEEFVDSLKPNCSLSTAITKLHQLCQVLSNVARLYIEAKAEGQTQESQALASVGHEFDTYLSALGLAPPYSAEDGDTRWAAGSVPSATVPGGMGYAETQNINPPMHHMTQLGNWFSGNQYMMGLLEEDLSMFDPSNFA